MSPKERDEIMERFRKLEIHVLITTNIIARGVDVPEAQLVINYDVPSQRSSDGKRHVADPENFLHRIGRTGRFGTNGVAVTIYDRDIDESMLDDILNHFQIKDQMQKLEGADHLKEVLLSLQDN